MITAIGETSNGNESLEEGDERVESAEEDVLVGNYRELNEIGQQKLVDYSNDLIATGNYERGHE